ncbi:MAG: type IV secretory system conjugative DNA transfer family protein [bacterium]
MFQLVFGLEPSLAVDNESFLNSQIFSWLVYLVIALAILAIGLIILKRFLQRRTVLNSPKKIILAVALPKDSIIKAGETPKSLIEQIGGAESLFSALGGLKPIAGWRSWLKGRTDQLALEIVAKNGLIYFYVAPPAGLERYVEEQIHAQYPQADIETVTDYNVFQPRSVIVARELKFVKSSIFPIRTYKDLGSDPLSSLTNSLSKLTKDDGAAIQFIIRSAKPGWHSRGKKVASEMQQGKSAREVMSESAPAKKFIRNWSEALKSKPKQNIQSPAAGYHLSPMEGEIIKGLEQKASKAGFDVNIRLVVAAPSAALAKSYLENIVNSFSQFNIYEFGNGFAPAKRRSLNRLVHDFIYRSFNEKNRLLLNTEELASVFHFPLPNTETPNIVWLTAKRAGAPINLPHEGICLGRNFYRGAETIINLKPDDRRRHLYLIGKSGTGKSVLLANLAIQDIANGEGVCVIDPHGDLIENILARIPKQRSADVIVFNPADVERPMGLNMLEAKLPGQTDFAVQEMIQIFYKLLPDPAMAGPMFEHYMRNALLLLMADKEPPGTLVELPRIFTDQEFRKKKLEKITDILVKDFWEREYEQSQKGSAAADMLSYVISKTGRFIENEMMRNIIGQPYSGFDFREIMDRKKILLVNLAKGQTGEINSNLLGLIIVSKLQMAAMSRADLPEEQRNDFYLYLDEFQNFTTPSIATILSEARKYRLNLILAHQYLGQLSEGANRQIRDAVLGTVGTMVAFKVGVEDAEVLAKEFAPVFDHYDLINIEKFNAYVKLLVDNQAIRAFNIETYPLFEGNQQLAYAIKDASRLKYGRPKKIVEAEILERSRLGRNERLTGENNPLDNK